MASKSPPWYACMLRCCTLDKGFAPWASVQMQTCAEVWPAAVIAWVCRVYCM